MRWLFPTLIALSPSLGLAQDPSATLSFVEDHCVQIAPAGNLYTLPNGWERAPNRTAYSWLPNLAIEEGIDYAAFIAHQVEVAKVVEPDRAMPLTVETYEDELSGQQSYTRSDWQRLFIHEDSGAHLFISAGEDTDNPDDWYPPTCYLWHPDLQDPLASAIIDRWDVPFGHRMDTPLGQATNAWNHVVIGATTYTLEARVIRPNTDFADGLAPVILKLQVRD